MTDKGVAGSAEQCHDVVTDQSRNYSVNLVLKIASSNADKTIDVKNAKVYGKKYESATQRYYYFPTAIRSSNVSINGGSFVADMSVYSLD